MNDFRKLLASDEIILFDGGMGTSLVKRGVEPGANLNEDNPDIVIEIHKGFINAGSRVILTNTFSANPKALAREGHADRVADWNRLGVDIARKAAGNEACVAGDMSTTGDLLEPYGTMTEDEAVDCFAAQAKALEQAGVDLFIVETMIDPRELALAVKAIKSVSGRPVVTSMSFDPVKDGFRTTMGTTVQQAVEAMAGAGAEALGLNCGGVGPDEVKKIVAEMKGHTELPIIAQMNAGKPEMVDGEIQHRLSPEDFGKAMVEIRDAGARLLGGCCGTTDEHIAAMRAALAG